MKIKVILLLTLAGVISVLAFLLFFYPDEKLQDMSDFAPAIQNVAQENNAYYLVESARQNYSKSSLRTPSEMIRFLTGKSPDNKTPIIDDEFVSQFLISQVQSIELLKQAVQLPLYEDPKVKSYQTLDLVSALPVTPSNADLIDILYVKGLYELKENQSVNGLQTIQGAMKLAAKMRKESLSIMVYFINHSLLRQGKDILNYFAYSGAITTAEAESIAKTFADNNRQDYINALKFEFQLQINTIPQFANYGNPITQNHFNFRKNATINALAENMRNIISEMKNLDCTAPPEESLNGTFNKWAYLFKENGIGHAYILSVSAVGGKKNFCDGTRKL